MEKARILNLSGKITEWSLYALIFVIPFSKSMIEICITTAIASWIIKKVAERDFRLKKTPANIFIFALFILSAISILNADFKMLAARALVSKCLKYLILYFVIVETIDSEKKLKNILKVAVISAILVMLDCYVQVYALHKDIFRGYLPFKYRPDLVPVRLGSPTGPFFLPNDLSAWMVVIAAPALCIFMWGLNRIRLRLIMGLFLAPFLFIFYIANARSAWAGFFAALCLVFSRHSKKVFLIFLIIFMVAVTFGPFILSEQKKSDIIGISSMEDRLFMWRTGWKIFLEHPFMGNGINMFFSRFKELREDEYRHTHGSYAHNGYLQIAADIGIFGLLVFLGIIAIALREALRFIKTVKNENHFFYALGLGLCGGLVAFLIQSFFDTNLHSLPLATFFWFNLAILMSLRYVERQERNT